MYQTQVTCLNCSRLFKISVCAELEAYFCAECEKEATYNEKIPFSQLEEALFIDNTIGFCLNCGEESYGVEPDARKYKCKGCGAFKVYGAEEILIMGEVDYES